MSHNKGKKYIKCPICDRKRYCTRYELDSKWYGRICSKGHEWKIEKPHAERIHELEINNIVPRLKALFDRDDTFYRSFKK